MRLEVETPTARFLRLVNGLMVSRPGLSQKQAVRCILSNHKGLCARVLDDVGLWPHSESAVAALQEMY